MKNKDRAQTRSEELANGVTHSLGVLFCLLAMPWVLAYPFQNGQMIAFFSTLAFGISMLMVYSFSSLYHFASDIRWKKWLKIGDHISIYFLIAGTYTPLMVAYLPTDTAILFLSIMWSVVALGVIFKLFFIHRFEFVSVLIYLVMGWMVVFIAQPLSERMPLSVFWWVLAGGLSYTGGVYFYVQDKRYHHTVWHLLVLLGTILHFVAIVKTL